MSRSEEYSYQLAALMRQQIFDERVSSSTNSFLQRYLSRYEQMVKAGYQEYIPLEMNRLKIDLDEINRLLVTNPVEAREISREVGSYINSVANLGQSVIKQFELKEKINQQKLQEERKKNKSEILKYFYYIIQNIRDPITRDFAKEDLENLKNSVITQAGKTDAELEGLKATVMDQFTLIINHATHKAKEWKERKLSESQTQSRIDQLHDVEENLKQENIENKERIEMLLKAINDMKQGLQDDKGVEGNFEEKLQIITDEIDETVISESTRREAVKAILKSLKMQDFIVGKPQIIVNGKGNIVKIAAKRPSGKTAECIVDLEGKIKYKFDEYEGMSCLKDIEKFNVDLEQIYSIKLSDQRILWENPNRISKDAKPICNDQSRRKG